MYVTASLTGNLVHITLSTRNDRFNGNYQGSMNTSSADTSVSGPIGQWIEVGGVSQSNQSTQSGYTRQYSTQGRSDSSLRVKVEVLD
jgi:hypothetical protein